MTVTHTWMPLLATALLFTGCSIDGDRAYAPDAARATEDFVRVRAGLGSGKDVVTHFRGVVYAWNRERQGTPLFGLEGFNIARPIANATDDGYFIATRELAFYTDLKTGAPLETWANPFTNTNVDVFHVQNDPVNFNTRTVGDRAGYVSMDGSIPFGPPKFDVVGDQVIFHIDVFPMYPLPDGRLYQSAELFNFVVEKDELDAPEDVVFTWTRIGPWLPWMEMTDQPGFLVYQARGHRVPDGFEGLPDWIREKVEREHPAFRTAPDSVDPTRKNASSWTEYEKWKATRRGASK